MTCQFDEIGRRRTLSLVTNPSSLEERIHGADSRRTSFRMGTPAERRKPHHAGGVVWRSVARTGGAAPPDRTPGDLRPASRALDAGFRAGRGIAQADRRLRDSGTAGTGRY